MTKKQVWRYRCDFCGKCGLSAGHMKNHESGCTANPERVCRMHKHCEDPQRPVAEMIAILAAHCKDKEWTQATRELREFADGCPACMLAAIRQSGLQKAEIDESGISSGADFGFDFKAELDGFWKTVNDAEAEGSCYQ